LLPLEFCSSTSRVSLPSRYTKNPTYKLSVNRVNAWLSAIDFESPDKRGAFDRSMQHHPGTDLFKGGDYDPTEEVEIISHGEARDMAPMEVRAVLARNRACSWQAASHHSQVVVA
jgi:hypothetical protein